MCDELDAIRIQQKQLMDRAGWLMRRVETYPTVQPVLVAYHYGSEDRDEAFADETDADPLLGAYEELLREADQGRCSPVGVEVGGALLKMDELAARYPDARAYF